MATNRASTTNGAASAPEKTYFEQQREMLVTEIAQVCMACTGAVLLHTG
jgi:DASH complex subunit DAD1